MYPNRSLTSYQQGSPRRSVAQGKPRLSHASEREVARSQPLASSQQFEGPRFLEQLLFDREQVYRDTARPFTAGPFTAGRKNPIEANRQPSPSLRATSYRQSQMPQTLPTPPFTSHFPTAAMARTKQTSRKPPAISVVKRPVKPKVTSNPATSRKRPATANARDGRAVKAAKVEDAPHDIVIAAKTERTRTAMLPRGGAASPINISDTDEEGWGTVTCKVESAGDATQEAKRCRLGKEYSKPIKHDWNFDFSSIESDFKRETSIDDPWNKSLSKGKKDLPEI